MVSVTEPDDTPPVPPSTLVQDAVEEELSGLRGVAATTAAAARRLAMILDSADEGRAASVSTALRAAMAEARLMGTSIERDPVEVARAEFGR